MPVVPGSIGTSFPNIPCRYLSLICCTHLGILENPFLIHLNRRWSSDFQMFSQPSADIVKIEA